MQHQPSGLQQEVVDLLSFDSWENESTTIAMSASTATSQSSSSDETANVQVSIAGVVFSLDPPTFDKMRKLPWQEVVEEEEGCSSYSLSTSPELFDVLVHHVMFGTLPHALVEHDKEELEIMALSLDLQDLAQHLAVAPPAPRRRRRRLQRQVSFDSSFGHTTACSSGVVLNDDSVVNNDPLMMNKKKTSAIRSWAAVKQWSSTSRLIKLKKGGGGKHHQSAVSPLRKPNGLAAPRHLA